MVRQGIQGDLSSPQVPGQPGRTRSRLPSGVCAPLGKTSTEAGRPRPGVDQRWDDRASGPQRGRYCASDAEVPEVCSCPLTLGNCWASGSPQVPKGSELSATWKPCGLLKFRADGGGSAQQLQGVAGPTGPAAANEHGAPVTGRSQELVYRTKPKELLAVFVAEEQPFLISLPWQGIGSTRGRQLRGLGWCPGDAV